MTVSARPGEREKFPAAGINDDQAKPVDK